MRNPFPFPGKALGKALLAVLLAGLPTAALAGQATVMNLNDTGPGSLRQAVLDAQASDQLVFASGLSGTVTLASGPIYITKQLTIEAPAAGSITLHAGSGYQVFIVDPVAVRFSLSRLTLTGGSTAVAASGGLIHSGADLNIVSCTMQNGKTLQKGGALFMDGADLQFHQNTVANNTAGQTGGALNLSNGSWYAMTSCTFSGNQAADGGGAINVEGMTAGDISFSTFTANKTTAYGSGGGALRKITGDMDLYYCTLSGNQAGGSGGALYLDSTEISIYGNTVLSGNQAAFGGGAIYCLGTKLTLTETTVSGNTALGSVSNYGGGGILQATSPTGYSLAIYRSVIENNTADTASAGGLFTASDAVIYDTLFSGNQAHTSGGGFYSYIGNQYFRNCTFLDNFAASDGGGAIAGAAASGGPHFDQCTFRGNVAHGNGGAVAGYRYIYFGQCTITGNRCGAMAGMGGTGGGLYTSSSSAHLTLWGSIAAGNEDRATLPASAANPDCSAAWVTGGYNLLGVGQGCPMIVGGSNGNLTGSVSVPLEPGLGLPGMNGSYTPTIPIGAASPALNANVRCLTSNGLAIDYDQRGRPRPRLGNCDMGAYELQAMPSDGMGLLLRRD